jgi:ribosomal protein S18 acetylase RimI-like enzyme
MTIRVQRLSDLKIVQAFLETDRRWAAYALCDLDPEFHALTEWYGAYEDDALRSLSLLFNGFDPPAIVTMGETRGVDAILNSALRAPTIYLNVRDEHMPAIRRHYTLETHEPMWRMVLDAQAFRPVGGEAVSLTSRRARELAQLYDRGGGNAFAASQMDSGTFYGVEQDGCIIAVAGTHVMSERYSAAAVGNVFTHPEHRGRGFGAVVTSAVCVDLIRRGIQTIILNVAKENAAAIRVYERLGFRKYAPFNEGVVRRV